MLGYSRQKISDFLEQAMSGCVAGRVSIGDPVANIGLPNITIMIDEELDEASAYMVVDDDPCERLATITIEARALLSDGTESPIDDLCLCIETAITSSTSLNDWCRDLRLITTEYDLDEEEFPVGLATLTYNGFYEEARINSISDIRYRRTPGMFTLECVSLFPSRIMVKAVNVATGAVYYSEQESADTIVHSVPVVVDDNSAAHIVTYIMNGVAYGIDLPRDNDPAFEDEFVSIANEIGG